MSLTANQLKSINPQLVWRSDKEINELISFLEERDFIWSDSRKVFRNEELEFTISVRNAVKFINNYKLLEKEIEKRKEKSSNKKEEHLGDIKTAGKIINFLVFLVVVNLFLGWTFLHPFFWAIVEIFLVVLLVSFVRMRKKIRARLKKAVYICH